MIHSYGKVLEVAGCPLRTGQTQPDFAFEYRIPGRGNQNEFARTNLGYLEVASPGIYRYYTVPIGGDPTNVYPEGKIIYQVSCKDVSGNIIANSSTDYTIHIINQVEAFKPVVTDFNCGDLLNNTPNKGGFVTYSLNSNACYEGVDGWYDVNAGNRLVSGSEGHISHTFRDDFAESRYIVKCSIRNIYQGSPSNRTTVNANSAYFYPKRRYLPPPVPRIFVTGKYGEFAKNHTSFEICADDALQFAFDGVFPAGKSFEDFKPYYDINWSVFGDTYRGRKLANAYDTPVFQTNESGVVELMYQVKGTWERGASSYDNICPGYGSTISQDPENKLIYDNNF
ncbi:hypothetical protein EB155_14480, partial [archaeon]|nr:hypothetical protein [archaeon]NDB81063.1 hypothetical protein [archaeon]